MTVGSRLTFQNARPRTSLSPRALLGLALCVAIPGSAGLLVARRFLPATPTMKSRSTAAPCAAGPGSACSAPEGAFDAEALDLPEGKPLLLEFASEHCSVCARMAPMMDELEARCARDAGIILRVEVDTPRGEALAARYGVRFLPTFLAVDASGVEVERVIGEQPRARLASLLTDVRGTACPATL